MVVPPRLDAAVNKAPVITEKARGVLSWLTNIRRPRPAFASVGGEADFSPNLPGLYAAGPTFTAQALSSAVPVWGSMALMVRTLVGT